MIRIRIDHLLVDGLPMNRADSAVFQAALTEALGSLLRSDPPAAGFTERRMRSPQMVAGGGPAALGEAVATSLHAALQPKAAP